MPANNQLMDGLMVRAQVAGGGLKWLGSDPGTGVMPDHQIWRSTDFWGWIKTNASNPFAFNYCMNWQDMQNYRKLNYSNYALRFSDSTGAWFDAASGPTIPSSLTVMMWVRRTSSSSNGVLFTHNFDSGTAGYGFVLEQTSGNVYMGTLSSGYTWSTASVTGALPLNTWVHVCATFDGSGGSGITIYINGTSSATLGCAMNSLVGGDIRLGWSLANSNVTNFAMADCDIDEVKYFNTAMVVGDVNTEMNNPRTSSANVLEYWQLENNLTATYGSNLSVGGGRTYSFVTDTGI